MRKMIASEMTLFTPFNLLSSSYISAIYYHTGDAWNRQRWQKSVVSITHEENIICSKTQLDSIAHEQTIICRQLFAGHVVCSRPTQTEKKCI